MYTTIYVSVVYLVDLFIKVSTDLTHNFHVENNFLQLLPILHCTTHCKVGYFFFPLPEGLHQITCPSLE